MIRFFIYAALILCAFLSVAFCSGQELPNRCEALRNTMGNATCKEST